MSDSFNTWTDAEAQEFFAANGFICARKLDSGDWVGIYPLLFTTSVCTGITPQRSYTYRWCFEDANEAARFFLIIQEYDDVPTERTSLKGHRYLDKPLLIEKDELGFDRW